MKRFFLSMTLVLMAFGLTSIASAQSTMQFVDVAVTFVNGTNTDTFGVVVSDDADNRYEVVAVPDALPVQATFSSNPTPIEIRLCTRAAIVAETCLTQPANLVTSGATAPFTATFQQSTNAADYFVLSLASGPTTSNSQSNGGFNPNQVVGTPNGSNLTPVALTNDPCLTYAQTGVGNTYTLTYTVPARQVGILEGFRINGSDDANAPYYAVRQPGTYSDVVLDGAVCIGLPNGSYAFGGTTHATLLAYRQTASRATLIGETLFPLVPVGGGN